MSGKNAFDIKTLKNKSYSKYFYQNTFLQRLQI